MTPTIFIKFGIILNYIEIILKHIISPVGVDNQKLHEKE